MPILCSLYSAGRRPLPASLTVLAIVGFLVTIDRVPIPWTDEVIYASIARAVQLTGTGFPTVLDEAPAIDHVGFYGPVFFALAAWLFDVFGFSAATFRAIGVAGALLIAVSGAALVRTLGGSRRRQWWSAAILLLTPEVGRGATDGRMDTLAVGLSLSALAVFAHGLTRRTQPWGWGAVSGLLLSAAMLTVPRSYPFVAAFLLATLAVPLMRGRDRSALSQWIAAAFVVAVAATVWAQISHGGVPAWLRFHWYLATHDDIEIAVATGALRRWSITPWQVVTSVAAATGLALVVIGRRHATPVGITATVVLAVTVGNAVVSAGIMNLTFALSTYFAIPLLAAVVATLPPSDRGGRLSVAITTLFALFVVAEGAVRLTRYARVAVTWPARDPAPLARFISTHVPRGSAVWGPDYFFIYAVEQAGSRYLTSSGISGADWARLVPQTQPARQVDPRASRFLLWPDGDDLPTMCPGSQAVARFDVPADHRNLLRMFGRLANSLPDTYHSTELYRLPPGCVVREV